MKAVTSKNITSFVFGTLFIIGLLTAITVDAKDKAAKEEKITIKARDFVENAEPNDWKAYAKGADKCIKKGVNLKEAESWLKKSMEIKKTPYNLEVQGDLYLAKNQLEDAIHYYLKSMNLTKEKNHEADVSRLQQKVQSLRKQY